MVRSYLCRDPRGPSPGYRPRRHWRAAWRFAPVLGLVMLAGCGAQFHGYGDCVRDNGLGPHAGEQGLIGAAAAAGDPAQQAYDLRMEACERAVDAASAAPPSEAPPSH